MGSIAAAKLGLHLALAARYGFHRDEFYYLACGRRPDWGYVDHPPLAPLVARGVEMLFGPDLLALRAVPALLGAGIVLLAALMARELGGRARAQIFAAAAVLATPGFLITNHFFQTVTFDQFAWALGAWLALRALRRDAPRGWLAVGAVAGVGLLAKHTVALFGGGLALGLLLAGRWRHLRSPWLWAGGALALAIAAPNLLWQQAHGWPTAEFVRNNNARTAEEFSPPLLLAVQGAFLGVAVLPLFAAGVARGFGAAGRVMRPLAWLWLTVTVALLLLGGKPYYAASAWPPILAAGGVAAAAWTERRGWRRAGIWLPLVLVLGAVPVSWIVLPVLPRAVFTQAQDLLPHQEFHEEFGWEDLAARVAEVWNELSPEERARACILTESYGEASALEILGPRHGLPRAYAAHNSMHSWGPPDAELVLAIAWGPERLERCFGEVRRVREIENAWAVPNQSSRQAIFLCRKPSRSWAEIWEELRIFV